MLPELCYAMESHQEIQTLNTFMTHKCRSLKHLKRKEQVLGAFNERLYIGNRHSKVWCQQTALKVTLADQVVYFLENQSMT